MIRRYGRAEGGKRCIDYTPGGHWKTLTLIAGLKQDGISAPWIFEGSMTGEIFKLYLKTQLLPTLRAGDIIICDNLSSHKVAGVKEIVQEAGVIIMYLPPYSPDFNPIENAFAKIKTLLRSAAERSIDKLINRIGKIGKELGRKRPSLKNFKLFTNLLHCIHFL